MTVGGAQALDGSASQKTEFPKHEFDLADALEKQLAEPVGVNIGVKPVNYGSPIPNAPEMKSSLVGPVGIEPTTCGLKFVVGAEF